MQPPDSELLAAWRRGDERAWATLFERHYPQLRTLATTPRLKQSTGDDFEVWVAELRTQLSG